MPLIELIRPFVMYLRRSGCNSGKILAECLEEWNCRAFMDEILHDAGIKQFIQKIVDSFKMILGKYSQVKNSPEGIQNIILYSCLDGSKRCYEYIIRNALLESNAIDDKNNFFNGFLDFELSEAAMKKPYKMIQIANTLSPPIVLNENDLTGPNLIKHSWHQKDLLQPNSFYVQAYVYPDHISFILNKAVVVSSKNNAVKKSTFTIQEETINIGSILDLACDFMWNHFQSLYFTDTKHRPFLNCCDKHDARELSVRNYFNFTANLNILMSKWVSNTQNYSITINY